MKRFLFLLVMVGFNAFASAAKVTCVGVGANNEKFQLKVVNSNLNIQYFKNNMPSGGADFIIENYYQSARFETFWAIHRGFLIEHYVHLYFSKTSQVVSYVRFGRSGLSGPDMGLPIRVKCLP